MFIVEDGSGVTNANAYISLADAEEYHDDRGNTPWTGVVDDTLKEQAIVRASDYIDKRFGRRFRGWRSGSDQGLEWPRVDAYDNDDYQLTDVPKQILWAVSEYAMRALSLNPLAPDPALEFNTRDTTGSGTTESAGNLKMIKEKVGPIETIQDFGDSFQKSGTTTSLSSLVNGSQIPAYPEADLWIEETLRSSASKELVRG